MKQLLSLLMCYVLLSAQTFAIRGWGDETERLLTGNFAGVMRQVSPAGPGTGLILFNAPASGAATGSFLLWDFSTGDVFSGTLSGLNDISTGTLVALMSGTKLAGSSTSVFQPTIGGAFNAKTKPGSDRGEITGTATTRAERVAGGSLQINYSMNGYQQAGTSTGFTPGSGSTGTTGTTGTSTP